MHPRIIYNNRLVEATKARVPSVTAATLYGRGVFTTLAVYQSRPFLWPEHWARLASHAEKVGVDCKTFDRDGVRKLLAKLIEANDVEEGRARITLLDGTGGGAWKASGTDSRRTNLLITTGDAARPPAENGLALTVSPHRINTLSPLVGVKCVNYLDHLMSWDEARARDFDEAVVLNERGEIASAAVANIFWVKDGTIHTPALTTGALAGTTRARVITLAGALSVPLVEGVYELSHLGDADEIFLTSAGLGVGVVTTFDFHRYAVAMGSVVLRLREAFRQLTLHTE